MPRTAAVLPEGLRISDVLSMGVLTAKIPREVVVEVLEETGRKSKRIRQLPAHVVVYYVIALALYMNVAYEEVLRCLVEGLERLGEPVVRLRNTGRSAISQARSRLGPEPMEMLFRRIVKPIGEPESKGVWFRDWRLVSIDGSILDVGDTEANVGEFGRPGASRGSSAFPQIRFVALAEVGTHALFDVAVGGCTTSEGTLADELIRRLQPEFLCLADRNFYSYARWKMANETGAALVWRVKRNMILPPEKHLDDGSYLSTIYATAKDRRHRRNGLQVRVIEYTLDGARASEPMYRLITTILDPATAPALELAELYHERWEIETAFDEFKIHLRGRAVVLRSKTPDLVLQEFYGLLLAHFAIRGFMNEAAITADVDSDSLSFTHALHVVRRKIQNGSFPPSGENGVRDHH
jgi:hypothetical protein